MIYGIRILVMFLVFTTGSVMSQNTTWNGAQSSDWTLASNWTNGVPTPNSNVKIGYIHSSNHQPILSSQAVIKKLTLGSNNQTLEFDDQAQLQVNGTLSIGNSGKINLGDGSLTVEKNSTIGGEIEIASGHLTFLKDMTLNGNGKIDNQSGVITVGSINNSNVNLLLAGNGEFQLGSGDLICFGSFKFSGSHMFYGDTGTIELKEDAQFNGGAGFYLGNATMVIEEDVVFTQGDNFKAQYGNISILGDAEFSGGVDFYLDNSNLDISGKTQFTGGAYFYGGNGTVTFNDDILFSGGPSFTPQESLTILNGSFSIDQQSNNSVTFNDVEVTSGSNINSNLNTTMNGWLDNNGNYTQNSNTTLNVVEQVYGYQQVISEKPYAISMEYINANQFKVVFNEVLDGNVTNGSWMYTLRNGLDWSSTINDQLSSSPILSPNGKELIFTTSSTITTNSTDIVWMNNILDIDGDHANSPHKKRFTEEDLGINYVWVGTTDDQWTTSSNWLNMTTGFPNPNGNINLIFDDNAIHDLRLPVNVKIHNYQNNGSANLDVNGKELKISGQFITNGSNYIKASDLSSVIYFNGEAAQNIPANVFEGDYMSNLVIDNPVSVSVDTPISVSGVVTLKQGDFNTNDQLTFKSFQSHTAVLAPIEGGQVVGEVITERYLPAKRAFRFISPSVTSTGSIKDNWQEGVNNTTLSSNLNPYPGYGTHITGSTTGQNGFDATASGSPSLYTFDDSTQSWNVVNNTNQNIVEAGKAYRLMVRGDRSINVTSNAAVPTNTVIRTKGNLAQGDLQFSGDAPNAGFIFLGNPYQAIVDMEEVLANSNNVNGQFVYLWDPTINERGAFVTVDANLNANSNSGSTATKYLQPGQAVFIKKVGGGNNPATINFTENNKLYSNVTQSVYRPQFSHTASIKVNMLREDSQSNLSNSIDGVIINFNSNFENTVDAGDAAKLFNLDENLAVKNGNDLLSIENKELPVAGDELQLANYTYRGKDYQFKIHVSEFNMLNASLYDAYLDIYTPLQNNNSTWVSFSVDENLPASIDPNRFKIVFDENSLDATSDHWVSNFQLYPNPSMGDVVYIKGENFLGNKVSIEIYDVVGNRVSEKKYSDSSSDTLAINVSSLADGIYIVKVNSQGKSFSKKLLRK
ncbi:T9SS type A sorting domain-containing protein [Mesonia sp. K4-1]|nr:T9SS type A sorting domain-containing protein [Mesonia sp. K4-1]